jgi:DnaJ-class molecular chaperone
MSLKYGTHEGGPIDPEEPTMVVCSWCYGSRRDPTGVGKCLVCHGRGKVPSQIEKEPVFDTIEEKKGER